MAFDPQTVLDLSLNNIPSILERCALFHKLT